MQGIRNAQMFKVLILKYYNSNKKNNQLKSMCYIIIFWIKYIILPDNGKYYFIYYIKWSENLQA